MEKQTSLIITGFFRTGNTFLESCIGRMYKNTKNISDHDHSVKYLSKQLNKENNIIIPVRNPVDTISSFYEFKKFLNKTNNGTVEMDIKFYTRYMNYVNDNYENLLCLDFDIFTKNTEYISKSIYKKFKISKTDDINLEEINMYMEKNKEMFFYKRNKFIANDNIKKYILNTEEIKDAQSIYNILKTKMEVENVR